MSGISRPKQPRNKLTNLYSEGKHMSIGETAFLRTQFLKNMDKRKKGQDKIMRNEASNWNTALPAKKK